MNRRCPITYEPLQDPEDRYSAKGLRQLHPRLKDLKSVGMDQAELLQEAAIRSTRMSVQGVQAKLSALLDVARHALQLVDQGGQFILKPQHPQWEAMPENEALTMQLARMSGIDTPPSGLVYAKDGRFVYWIKRFDRKPKGIKTGVGDFAQLLGESRDTKYRSSVEKVVSVIDQFCSFPSKDKAEFFKRFIFNFLVGNEDMHLKNYSLVEDGKLTRLAPAYDFLNSAMVLRSETESALPLAGKTKRLSRSDIVDYLGRERCGLSPRVIEKILRSLLNDWECGDGGWKPVIERSFLTNEQRQQYLDLVGRRWQVLA